MKIFENKHLKVVRSSDYNYQFNKDNGYFVRFGKTKDDDPELAPAPEIADIEVTTICDGVGGKVCKHCYKSNTSNGNNMSLETFKRVFDKISSSRCLTQIAFGADSHGTSNPDLIDMMWYCRNNGVIPNITVADISDETAEKLASVCGAVAVSRYEDKDACYDSIQKLTKYGLEQINIHSMVSLETYPLTMETLNDRRSDPRLKPVKAIVLLSLKQKGRGQHFHRLPEPQFKKLVQFAMENDIGIGFDSCSAYKFLQAIKDRKDFNRIEQYVEPCESTLFSIFVNWRGEAFPCSFTDGCVSWARGIDVPSCDDFVIDVWNSPRMLEFRNGLLNTKKCNTFNCRTCPVYDV